MHKYNKENLAPSYKYATWIVQVYNNYMFVELW